MAKTFRPARAKPESPPPAAAVPKPAARNRVKLPPTLSVKELAELLELTSIEVIKQLMRNGIMAGINQVIDFNTAGLIATDLGFKVEALVASSKVEQAKKKKQPSPEEDSETLVPRPPVVTIMGHVDHGKTSLLDAIRKTHVTETEAGNITQHIGAYQVMVNDKKVTFLDTPGHEAFTAMRARGARVTDLAILVVAADDGVMPQTIEAINHVKAAEVPIMVALNKTDMPTANADRVKQQLGEQGLVIEEWGGDVVCVPVSAKTGEGVSDLLDNLLVVTEMEDLKGNPLRPAVGTVIEARLDKTRGPIATALIQNGTLKAGDTVVVGETWGRVKAMFNDARERVQSAGPADPVEILGLATVPRAGDTLTAVANERQAKERLEEHRTVQDQLLADARRAMNLEELYSQIKEGITKDLNIVLKTDVQGTIDPLKNSLENLSTEQVNVRIIHYGSGSITESDVMLALASKGVIIGFNVRPEPGARTMADRERVDIRHYDVIYRMVEAVAKALKGMLEPVYRDVLEGHARVKAVFSTGKKTRVAGVMVTDGRAVRNALARVNRGGEVVVESSVTSLKRFKDDVSEVSTGVEAGVGIEGYNDFEPDDIIEFYRRERSD
ncbi:MAG: translation initiation factor IF-2 [Dehalococcoidia bacterium]